jgi:hypothetical protein
VNNASYWPLPRRGFHMAEAENWASIKREGLLSTELLLRREVSDDRTTAAVRAYRQSPLQLPSGVIVRDQLPMPPSSLARCLRDGRSPEDWYRLLNEKVFFWLSIDRLNRHLKACAGRPQIVLVLDLWRLVARYEGRSFVTPFNVGNARRRAAPRGARTFVPLRSWLDTRWASEAAPGRRVRPRTHSPAELAVRGAVPDVMEFIVTMNWVAPGESLSTS